MRQCAVENRRAVVIMSGGDAVSPFTTPDQACATGLAAGNTDTAMRSHLLAQGYRVFTAPAMNARTEVRDPAPDSFGAFGGMPVVLPSHLTVNSLGDIDAAGEHLARFIGYLHAEYGVDEVDWIGHSNGGLFARAATRVLQETGAPVTVRSLTTLGTPWLGSVPLRYLAGEITMADAGGDPIIESLFKGLAQHAAQADLGLVRENTEHYLGGPGGWNAAQEGVLAGIPVLMVAGTHFDRYPGDPTVWPLDGLVSRYSALAMAVSVNVLPEYRRLEFPVTHSIFICDVAGLAWETGMTWNPEVLAAVSDFLAEVAPK